MQETETDPLPKLYVSYADMFSTYPSLYFNTDSVTNTFPFLSFFFYIRWMMCGRTNLSERAENNGIMAFNKLNELDDGDEQHVN